MAKQRMIVSDIWEDDFFTSLPIFDRLLWIGLITSCADDQGRLQDNAALIRSKVFPVDDVSIKDVEAGLNRIGTAHKIARYTAGEKRLIQILNWWKHQSPRWAGKSNYPAPDGWIDRERYHGPGNEIVQRNWESKGGYIAGYTAPNTKDDVKGDVKGEGNGDIKGEGDGDDHAAPPPDDDPFVVLQRTAEKAGIMVASADDSKELTKLVNEGATADDMLAGIAWKVANNGGKAIQYFSQIVGPTRTAVLKRKQGAIPASATTIDPFAAARERYAQQ